MNCAPHFGSLEKSLLQIAIVIPPTPAASGNQRSANRYQSILRDLGHTVTSGTVLPEEVPEVLIVLHADKCHGAIKEFEARHPKVPLVLVLAGTDIYPEPSERATDSMHVVDRLVGLQDRACLKVPPPLREKFVTIVQSAEPIVSSSLPTNSDCFEICVVGHLRRVKDPLRAAAAARLLPSSSKIQIRHAGRIREPEFEALVEREVRENPRYTWLGELAPEEARRLIARSRLEVLSSHAEGGAQVLGEAVVAGTPLLVSRHDAALALLGEDYPGLFDVGATEELASLMTRAETDASFMKLLQERTGALAGEFSPERERDAWKALLSELDVPNTACSDT